MDMQCYDFSGLGDGNELSNGDGDGRRKDEYKDVGAAAVNSEEEEAGEEEDEGVRERTIWRAPRHPILSSSIAPHPRHGDATTIFRTKVLRQAPPTRPTAAIWSVQPQGPGPKLTPVQHDRVIQLLGRRCVIGGEEEHRRSTRTLVPLVQRLLHSQPLDGVGGGEHLPVAFGMRAAQANQTRELDAAVVHELRIEMLIALDDDSSVVGAALLSKTPPAHRSPGFVTLQLLAVDKTAERAGLGSRLLDAACALVIAHDKNGSLLVPATSMWWYGASKKAWLRPVTSETECLELRRVPYLFNASMLTMLAWQCSAPRCGWFADGPPRMPMHLHPPLYADAVTNDCSCDETSIGADVPLQEQAEGLTRAQADELVARCIGLRRSPSDVDEILHGWRLCWTMRTVPGHEPGYITMHSPNGEKLRSLKQLKQHIGLVHCDERVPPDSQSEDVAQSWQKTAGDLQQGYVERSAGEIEEEVEVDLSASSDDDRCYDRADPDELHRTELRRNFLLSLQAPAEDRAAMSGAPLLPSAPTPAPTKVAHPAAAHARPSKKAHGKDKKAVPPQRKASGLFKAGTMTKDGRVPWWSVLPGFACPKGRPQAYDDDTERRGEDGRTWRNVELWEGKPGDKFALRKLMLKAWMPLDEDGKLMKPPGGSVLVRASEPQDQARHHPDDRERTRQLPSSSSSTGVEASAMPPPLPPLPPPPPIESGADAPSHAGIDESATTLPERPQMEQATPDLCEGENWLTFPFPIVVHPWQLRSTDEALPAPAPAPTAGPKRRPMHRASAPSGRHGASTLDGLLVPVTSNVEESAVRQPWWVGQSQYRPPAGPARAYDIGTIRHGADGRRWKTIHAVLDTRRLLADGRVGLKARTPLWMPMAEDGTLLRPELPPHALAPTSIGSQDARQHLPLSEGPSGGSSVSPGRQAQMALSPSKFTSTSLPSAMSPDPTCEACQGRHRGHTCSLQGLTVNGRRGSNLRSAMERGDSTEPVVVTTRPGGDGGDGNSMCSDCSGENAVHEGKEEMISASIGSSHQATAPSPAGVQMEQGPLDEEHEELVHGAAPPLTPQPPRQLPRRRPSETEVAPSASARALRSSMPPPHAEQQATPPGNGLLCHQVHEAFGGVFSCMLPAFHTGPHQNSALPNSMPHHCPNAAGADGADLAEVDLVLARYCATRFGGALTKLYPGTIAKVYGDGTYDIRYDDGDYEEHALRKFIQLVRRAGQPDAAALSKPKQRSTAGSTAAGSTAAESTAARASSSHSSSSSSPMTPAVAADVPNEPSGAWAATPRSGLRKRTSSADHQTKDRSVTACDGGVGKALKATKGAKAAEAEPKASEVSQAGQGRFEPGELCWLRSMFGGVRIDGAASWPARVLHPDHGDPENPGAWAHVQKARREGRILVRTFGDGCYVWAKPSSLSHFDGATAELAAERASGSQTEKVQMAIKAAVAAQTLQHVARVGVDGTTRVEAKFVAVKGQSVRVGWIGPMGLTTWHSGVVVDTSTRVGRVGCKTVVEFRVEYDSGRIRWHSYDDTDWNELEVAEVAAAAQRKRPCARSEESEERPYAFRRTGR